MLRLWIRPYSLEDLVLVCHITASILNLLHRLLNNTIRRLIRVRDDDLPLRGRDSGSDGEERREGCEDLELHS